MGILGKTKPVRDPMGLNCTPEQEMERIERGVEQGENNTPNEYQRVPTFQKATNAWTMQKEYINGYIWMGNDRPGDLTSGYGGQGGTECATIDFCAGAASSLRKKGSGKTYGKDDVIGPLMASDASRIYISQQTDIDQNFGLPTTHGTSTTGHAAIGIKSDHIRVIGRSTVRLYAGKGNYRNQGLQGEKNARGEEVGKTGKIEFIAGDVNGLQPLPRGTNLQKCLEDIYDKISEIRQAFLIYDQAIIILRTALMSHVHSGAGIGYVQGFPSPNLIGSQIQALQSDITNVQNNVFKTVNVVTSKANYLNIMPPGQGPLSNASFDSEMASIDTNNNILSKTVFST